ncbi:hypothetical protein [Geopsychrobacter electrodiphilus]|uniref:hypothetical protein n=1 Tax=Geopsychrobacter electrodiphilus TaxID=225196 RepID=UPI00036FFB42|nr:hypothetical protein [Geopsychrobacter electrodiphilus]
MEHRKEFHGTGCNDACILVEDLFFLNEVLHRAAEILLRQPELLITLKLVTDYFRCDIAELRLLGQNRQISRMRARAARVVSEGSAATLSAFGQWLALAGR